MRMLIWTNRVKLLLLKGTHVHVGAENASTVHVQCRSTCALHIDLDLHFILATLFTCTIASYECSRVVGGKSIPFMLKLGL